MTLKNRRFPFYVGISTLVLGIVVALSGLFLWVSYRESRTAALHSADRLFTEINAKTRLSYETALEAVAVLAGTAAHMPDMAVKPTSNGMAHPGITLMLDALSVYEYLYSTYTGYEDGSFLQVVAVRDRAELRALFAAPPGTAFVLRTLSVEPTGTAEQRWFFLDRDRQVIGEGGDLDPNYDPRTRPWYTRAQREETAFFSEPYIFSSSKIPGITCAERLAGGSAVFGADITLDRFAVSLERQKVSDNGVLFLFDRQGHVIAHPYEDPVRPGAGKELTFLTGEASGDPRVRAVMAAFRQQAEAMLDQTYEMEITGSAYLVRVTPIKAALKFDQMLAAVAPVSDFTGHIRKMQQRIYLFSGLVLLVMVPLALLVSHKIAGSLTRLEQESIKIRRSDFSASEPFDSSIKEIHSLVKAFFLMKSKIRTLLDQQRKLFDDFTKLIAGAIDAKSPYTGGHCARVPVVAQMLAEAACESNAPPFAEFTMQTADQRWEFEVAAWLHDCGKVTTPEFVVDKATKLETIYNRIHEIRMRFEVLLRDAEIECYRRRLAGDLDEGRLEEELEQTRKAIVDDFAFIAACNVGGEFMADEKIDRLRQIARRTWVRHLDDRLGISQEEAALKNRVPAPALPVIEPVLADKPEHVIPRTQADPLDNYPYGFSMTVPKDQYNLGELYNLGIRKGTLSPEDRFKINEHIIQTIIMLKRLDFPDYLANVPEFAGAHHETMIGTGYPRGLKKEEMSIPARIMAIADIFEALTAADRPYKTPKSLSEALKIMSMMRDDQHIDADLFDLFLKSGVYRTYADRYLSPSQIDEVDIHHFEKGSKGVKSALDA
jgi:HD-GYP domain-containing protein (c-di-GMP phosphodiesterase class II)